MTANGQAATSSNNFNNYTLIHVQPELNIYGKHFCVKMWVIFVVLQSNILLSDFFTAVLNSFLL